MASPAAVLSVLVQAQGIVETNRKLKNIQDSSEKAAKSTGNLEGRFSNLDNTVGDFNRTMTATGNVVKLVKFPAMIAGAGLATQAIGALSAGAISLGSALAPLSGLAAAGAAGYAALGQAAGTVKLATMGLTEALGGNKDALKALPPAGKELVAVLNGLKPKLKDLQQTAAAGLLPGLGEGVKAALPILGPLKRIISGTAQALGDLAAQAGKLVGSKSTLRDLTTIGATNVTVIRNVGTAALSLAHALLSVVAAGGPLLVWLTQGGVKLAAWIDAQVKAGRESGKLAGFLDQTKQVLQTLGPIFVNLAAGLYNIGKAAAPLGRDLLGQFEKLTEKFREWTESASGKNQIAAYFQAARGPILQIVGLIGDIGGALLRISQGKGASALVAQLRTLVPVLENVVTSTTAAFGPALIDALGNVLRLFGLLAGSSGPLVQLVRLIGLIAQGLTALLTSVPGLNSMTVSFIGLYGSLKAVSVVFGPIVAGAKALEVALLGQTVAANLATGATIRERVAMLATAAAMYASAAATGVMTVATTALDVALAILTSPITLVIAGLAALAVALIYAYKHSETFRKIVDAMWATMKVVAAWMVTFGAAAFTTVGNAAKTAWTTVQTVTTTVWGGIKTFLTGVWSGLQTTATTVWNAIKTVVLTPIRAIRDALGGKDGIWAQIHDGAIAAWDKIKSGVANFAGDIKDGVVKAFEGAVNAVIDFVNKIIDVVNVIPGVPNIKHIGHVGGSGGGKSSGGKGGPNGTGKLAKGGMVPGSGYGDKVPLHIAGKLAAMVEPGEMVSVANRNATAALMGVNSAVPRYATGGILTVPEMAEVWGAAGGALSKADTMGVIGFAESGGNPTARNPSGASGLWQILGQVVAGNIFNPRINALNAIKKSDNGRNLHPWDASRAKWSKLIGEGPSGQGGGLLGAINPLNLISKLPGVGSIPDWLKGTGKYILEHVKDYITGAVVGIGGGGIGNSTENFSKMIAEASRIDAMDIPYGPQGHSGWALNKMGEDCSSSVSKVLHAAGFLSSVLTTVGLPAALDHGSGKMVTVHDRALAGNAGHTIIQLGNKFWGTSGSNPGGGPGWISTPSSAYLASLPTKLHPKGMATGGVLGGSGLPFLGSYHTGGVAPREGLAHVSAGERMTPAGNGGPLVNIEHAEFGSQIDVNSFAAKLGFKIATT